MSVIYYVIVNELMVIEWQIIMVKAYSTSLSLSYEMDMMSNWCQYASLRHSCEYHFNNCLINLTGLKTPSCFPMSLKVGETIPSNSLCAMVPQKWSFTSLARLSSLLCRYFAKRYNLVDFWFLNTFRQKFHY